MTDQIDSKELTASPLQSGVMRLEDWGVVGHDDPYTAPECRKYRLHGKVYGHPRFKDGDSVTTSSIDKTEGKLILTRSGSKYELGKVNSEYEALYPNAEERLFSSLGA